MNKCHACGQPSTNRYCEPCYNNAEQGAMDRVNPNHYGALDALEKTTAHILAERERQYRERLTVAVVVEARKLIEQLNGARTAALRAAVEELEGF